MRIDFEQAHLGPAVVGLLLEATSNLPKKAYEKWNVEQIPVDYTFGPGEVEASPSAVEIEATHLTPHWMRKHVLFGKLEPTLGGDYRLILGPIDLTKSTANVVLNVQHRFWDNEANEWVWQNNTMPADKAYREARPYVGALVARIRSLETAMAGPSQTTKFI